MAVPGEDAIRGRRAHEALEDLYEAMRDLHLAWMDHWNDRTRPETAVFMEMLEQALVAAKSSPIERREMVGFVAGVWSMMRTLPVTKTRLVLKEVLWAVHALLAANTVADVLKVTPKARSAASLCAQHPNTWNDEAIEARERARDKVPS